MGKTAKRLAWIVCLSAAACAGSSSNVPPDRAAGEYRIGADDVVEVAVWRDHDVSRTVPVRPDGRISLPLLGDVQAAGFTADELQQQLEAKLVPYLDKPSVTVIVREINSRRFYVLGQVAHPGVFPLRGRVSVLQALAQAGGFGEFADQNGLVLLRHDRDRVKRYSLRYDDLVSASEAVYLDPGDTLVVP